MVYQADGQGQSKGDAIDHGDNLPGGVMFGQEDVGQGHANPDAHSRENK